MTRADTTRADTTRYATTRYATTRHGMTRRGIQAFAKQYRIPALARGLVRPVCHDDLHPPGVEEVPEEKGIASPLDKSGDAVVRASQMLCRTRNDGSSLSPAPLFLVERLPGHVDMLGIGCR